MKEHFQHGELIPAAALTGKRARRQWRSPEEFTGDGDVKAPEEFDEAGVNITESDRRRFLSLMAGSLALAGLAGCTRQPAERIYPYVIPPETAVPGRPKFYATAVPLPGGAEGVLVESHLGRPTKVEGNPAHPASLGATSVASQACLMDLYDPDRARAYKHLGVASSSEAFALALERILAPLRDRGGAGIHILSESVVSPVLGAQLQAVLKQYPNCRWHQFEPVGARNAAAGARAAFGRPVHTYYAFDRADVVVALDSDFLACGPASTRNAHDFAERRRRGDRSDMNRLYAVESTMTSTGGKADHRLALRYGDIEQFAAALARAVGVAGAPEARSADASWVNALAADLQAHAGAGIVIPGEHQSPAVHALAHHMNGALGNAAKTVFYTEPLEAQPADSVDSLRDLAAALHSGAVELLVVLGGNPVYNAPADLGIADALARAKASVRLGLHEDETSAVCQWHIPESHFLEEWGDARAYDGTITIQQPLIAPLFDSLPAVRLLDWMLLPAARTSYEIVRSYWQGRPEARAHFEAFWRKSVHDGVVDGSSLARLTPALREAASLLLAPAATGSLEVVFRPDPYLYDGRSANNVWLQELPRPMTKLTWDNAVMLSPKTARALKLRNQQRVDVSMQGRKVRGGVWILPGQPEGSATIHLGWGRWRSGRAGNGAGFSGYKLRTSDALWNAANAAVTPVEETYSLATTQMQQTMEGRDPALHAEIERYRRDPGFAKSEAKEPEKNETLYPHWSYTGYAWGMAIDLTACVNCNACVVACQAENNIPVVGKEQVLFRRAMHWLRIDTYYEGNLDAPTAYYQPVPCMQCENAPCELVCPVQATNHSSDGLNDMIYNRCVGTRYCSNNCPYKVRRFNFLLYADWNTDTWKLQRNPDVTVRSRGVMEKCTYCVQRIREAEIEARDHDGFIPDGRIQTACQQACPTKAIMFGDINNAENQVAKWKAEKLNYALLAELNTRPRTTYLAELRNPNPALEGNEGS